MPQPMELNSWTAFKSTCITTKNLYCQYVQTADRYELYGPDANGLLWHTSILTGLGGSDQTDFETNYKSLFNLAIGSLAFPFSTPAFTFYGNGITASAAANSTTNIDFLVPGNVGSFYYINGANLFTSNANFGDYGVSSVIDVNNVLGYGANFVVSSYIKKWYINPNESLNVDTPYAAKIPSGVYIRTSYTNTSLLTPVSVYVNYRMHTANPI